jgi:hypothetical protein
MFDTWKLCKYELPPEGKEVNTKLDDEHGIRNVQKLIRRGNFWLHKDGNYVYYTPTHWSY